MILIINCGSQKTVYIEESVDEFMDFKTVPFHSLNRDDLLDIKGIIISGAPLLITEIDMSPYLEKVNWLTTIDIPVLGICFGHQLIGLTYGAFGSRMKEDRDWQIIEVFEECELFQKLPTEIEMMEDHCESISIPSISYSLYNSFNKFPFPHPKSSTLTLFWALDGKCSLTYAPLRDSSPSGEPGTLR